MAVNLNDIAKITSGIYAKSGITPDILYLQAVDYNEFGELDPLIQPKLSLNKQTSSHLLQEGDILFAAKGGKNFAVVYHEQSGKAVASSSFIVIQIKPTFTNTVLPEYLAWFMSHKTTIRSFHKQQLGMSISIKMLKEVAIHIPPIEKQQLVTRIHSLRHTEKKLALQLTIAKEKKIEQLLLNTIKE